MVLRESNRLFRPFSIKDAIYGTSVFLLDCGVMKFNNLFQNATTFLIITFRRAYEQFIDDLYNLTPRLSHLPTII